MQCRWFNKLLLYKLPASFSNTDHMTMKSPIFWPTKGQCKFLYHPVFNSPSWFCLLSSPALFYVLRKAVPAALQNNLRPLIFKLHDKTCSFLRKLAWCLLRGKLHLFSVVLVKLPLELFLNLKAEHLQWCIDIRIDSLYGWPWCNPINYGLFLYVCILGLTCFYWSFYLFWITQSQWDRQPCKSN